MRLLTTLLQPLISLIQWCVGLVCLVVGLSILATIPVLQFVSLGYLLDCSARVARRGQFFGLLPGVRTAARIGIGLLASWLLVQPLRLVIELGYSARLIREDGQLPPGWKFLITVVRLLTFVHLTWAWVRGARIRDFAWPAPKRLIRYIGTGIGYQEIGDRLWNFLVDLRLHFYFWLGLRGFVVALSWLFLPISIMVVGTRLSEAAALPVELISGLALAAILLYLPFLQINFAIDNSLRSGFDLRRVRQQFDRAPIALWIGLLATLALALPLYVLKAELVPREALWLPSIVFIVSILPARLLVGWALGRSRRQEKKGTCCFVGARDWRRYRSC